MLKNKAVLITGGGSGIGEAAAKDRCVCRLRVRSYASPAVVSFKAAPRSPWPLPGLRRPSLRASAP
jgi:hypothetical protein